MADLNEAYIADLREGMVKAIHEVSRARQGDAVPGKPQPLYIGAAEVCQTLVILLAEFIERGPGLDSPGDVRRMTETIAKKLRLGVADIRRLRAETGAQPPPTLIIRPD